MPVARTEPPAEGNRLQDLFLGCDLFHSVQFLRGGILHRRKSPFGWLTLGTDGNFYATSGGGTKNAGTIYKITPAGVKTTLYNFCDPTCNGYYAGTPLVQHTNGKFYGNTSGNSLGGAVFYSMSVGLKPFVRLVTWNGKVGRTVEVLGQGFTGTTQVLFNGTPATFTNVSDTYMTAVVPDGASTGYVTVTTFTSSYKSDRKFL